ncbi:hypothetical protein NYA8BAC_00497 [Psychrobacter okhotskensis]|jgi:hypothetical protein
MLRVKAVTVFAGFYSYKEDSHLAITTLNKKPLAIDTKNNSCLL